MTLIHRKIVIISPQIMEAGVDIGALAGLYVIQASGRINRKGKLYVCNFNENLINLDYIRKNNN
jgi:CRISPR/Cas system-associated endonuclease/helicase Cas3